MSRQTHLPRKFSQPDDLHQLAPSLHTNSLRQTDQSDNMDVKHLAAPDSFAICEQHTPQAELSLPRLTRDHKS